MDDHELNEAMRKLCEIPLHLLRQGPDGSYDGSEPYPHIWDEELHICEVERECKCVKWDPANDWRQVHEFVIPALKGMKLGMFIHYEEEEPFAMVQLYDWSWEVTVNMRKDVASSRVACEAALGAWKKLEKTK